MTFSDALDRLPKCSYAVSDEETSIGPVVKVWFLYYEGPEKTDDPEIEGGPCVDVQGTYYDDSGRRAGGGPEDWMPAEEVPEETQALDWRPVEIGHSDFPSGYHVNVILHVLNGKPLEEARFADELPPQMPEWTRL